MLSKEEILAKSREENKNKDIAELDIINRASRIAVAVGVIICLIISTLDWTITKTVNCGAWMVDFGILTALFTVKYIRLKRKHELVVGIVYFLIFLFFTYGYIFNLVMTAQ